MKLKKIFFFFTIFFLLINIVSSKELIIKLKINNEIITNFDIKNERNYLAFLNPSINQLDDEKIINISKNSLIKESIKRNELKKYFDIKKDYEFINTIEKNLIKKKKLNNKKNLEKHLKSINLDYLKIRDKLKLEALWNQLIYDKYIKNVKIDEDKLKKRIIEQHENSAKNYEFNLSEILFEEQVGEDINHTLKKIKNSIERVGFENSANLYSISNTSKNGGLIGWINEFQINENIRKIIKNMKIDEISKPFKVPNGYLVLKLNDAKEIKTNLNLKKELDKLIKYEQAKQLNNYSIIYYKKLKKNAAINEY